jgi:hypothetical protein
MNAAVTPGGAALTHRALHRLYLTLFLRGRSARGLRKAGAPASIFSKLALTLIFYGIFGAFAFYFIGGPIFLLALYLHGMTMVFCGLFVANSAGETLFNKEEADILLHRPVSPQALLRAKLTVLVQVSLWIAGAFNLAGTIGGLETIDAKWWFPFVHMVSVVLVALFCTSCVVLGYELCLRYFGRELLENVMTAVQIVVAVVMVLAGQLVPRMLRVVGPHLHFRGDAWWVCLLPPAWFAGFDDALAGSGDGRAWLLGLMGAASTVTLTWLALGRMARHYQAGLQLLGEAPPARPLAPGRRRLTTVLVEMPPLSWWLRDPIQRAAFFLVASYLVRDRDVKLRVYPSMAPMLIVPVIMLFQTNSGLGGGLGFGVAFAGAYLGMIPMMGVGLLQFSQQWAAADIFRMAPLAGPARICAGVRRAVTCYLTVPLVVAYTLITFLLCKDKSSLALVVPGLLLLPIYTLVPHLGGKGVPLAQASEEARSASRGLLYSVALVGAMIVAGLATWARSMDWFGWFLLGEVVVVSAVYFPMRQSLATTRWPVEDD